MHGGAWRGERLALVALMAVGCSGKSTVATPGLVPTVDATAGADLGAAAGADLGVDAPVPVDLAGSADVDRPAEDARPGDPGRLDTGVDRPDAAIDAAPDLALPPDSAANDAAGDVSNDPRLDTSAQGPPRNCVPGRKLPAWTSVRVVEDRSGAPHGVGIAVDGNVMPWIGVTQSQHAVLAHAQMLDRATGGVLWALAPVRVAADATYPTGTTAVRLDPAGQAHLLLSHQSGQPQAWTVYHAISTGVAADTPRTEIVTKAATTSQGRLVLDGNNVPHVAFAGFGSYRHAYKPADAWIEEDTTLPVAPGLDIDESTKPRVAVAIDGAGTIAVAGVRGAAEVNVAVRTNGVWTRELTFAEPGGKLLAPALFFDDSGALHLFFLSPFSSLRHAVRTGGTWSAPYPIADSIGEDLAAAAGKNGQLHVIATTNNLDYYFFDGTCWSVGVVEPALPVGHGWLSLAVDANGRPHAAYFAVNFAKTVSEFRYAYQVGTP
jgi:hypothetical protein